MAYSDGVPLLPGDGAAGDRHDASAIEAHRQAAHGTDELLRQLARRAEHQGLWPAGRRHSHVQALKQRQAKDNRLAAASLRLADHIAPGERGWQGPLLDVRQRRVPQALGASKQLWAERAQALKRQSFRSHGRERHAPEAGSCPTDQCAPGRHRSIRARREQRGVAHAEGEHSRLGGPRLGGDWRSTTRLSRLRQSSALAQESHSVFSWTSACPKMTDSEHPAALSWQAVGWLWAARERSLLPRESGGGGGGEALYHVRQLVHSFVLALAGPPLARGALTLTHGGPLRSRAELGLGPAVHPIGSLSPRGAA